MGATYLTTLIWYYVAPEASDTAVPQGVSLGCSVFTPLPQRR